MIKKPILLFTLLVLSNSCVSTTASDIVEKTHYRDTIYHDTIIREIIDSVFCYINESSIISLPEQYHTQYHDTSSLSKDSCPLLHGCDKCMKLFYKQRKVLCIKDLPCTGNGCLPEECTDYDYININVRDGFLGTNNILVKKVFEQDHSIVKKSKGMVIYDAKGRITIHNSSCILLGKDSKNTTLKKRAK